MLDTLVRHLDMVRLSVGLAAAMLVALSACNGLVSSHPGSGDDDDGTATPEEQKAIALWTSEALPAFTDGTCVSCHEGEYPTENFLQASSDAARRDSILAFNPQVVDPTDPVGSRVLSKGAHEGPALSADETQGILDWINAEKDAQAVDDPTPIIETAQFIAQICTAGVAGDPTCPVNHVGLSGLSLPGAEVDFVAQREGDDLYLTDLVVIASADGVYMEHPLFTTFPPPIAGVAQDPLPDLLDRFFDVKLDLAPSATTVACPPVGGSCGYIGAGASVFHDFDPANPLTISFKVLGVYMDNSTPPPPPTGCATMGFASFLANVEPLMDVNTACISCHNGQNAGATSAMPLTGLTSTTDNTACLSVRAHVNFQDTANSGLLLAPDSTSGDTAHPFKLSGTSNPTITNFKTAVNTWITVEATGM